MFQKHLHLIYKTLQKMPEISPKPPEKIVKKREKPLGTGVLRGKVIIMLQKTKGLTVSEIVAEMDKNGERVTNEFIRTCISDITAAKFDLQFNLVTRGVNRDVKSYFIKK